MTEVKWVNWKFAEENGLCGFCIEGEELPFNSVEIEKIVRVDVIRNHYIFAGDYHQAGTYGVPVVYRNGNPVGALCYSMRRWGAFMDEIWGKGYTMGYMDFYMTQCIPKYLTEKLPYGG